MGCGWCAPDSCRLAATPKPTEPGALPDPLTAANQLLFETSQSWASNTLGAEFSCQCGSLRTEVIPLSDGTSYARSGERTPAYEVEDDMANRQQRSNREKKKPKADKNKKKDKAPASPFASAVNPASPASGSIRKKT